MIRLMLRYIRYLFLSGHRKGHGVHSPYAYRLINEVISSRLRSADSKMLESEIRRLRRRKTLINVSYIGSGSKVNNKNRRSISDIARNSSIRTKYGNLLYRLASDYNPETILELGTGIGISTSWLALAAKNKEVLTVEGASEKLEFARNFHGRLGFDNIRYVSSDFDEFLNGFQAEQKPLLVFIDGNHTYEATMRYFKCLSTIGGNDCLLIFDDIYWSEGMERAWKEIISHDEPSLTIDLFYIGLVYFKKGMARQDFILKF